MIQSAIGESGGPIVILAVSHSGAENIQALLSATQALTCTISSGILPVCEAVAITWGHVENGRVPLSALGLKSIRALASSMITTLTANAGGSRWCEVTTANAGAASVFHQAFPATRFICLYRGCRDVISDVMARHPWGLGGTVFWKYSAAHPGNSIATTAAYWVDCTTELLKFEDSHPDACLRMRYEDFCLDSLTGLDVISKFAGLPRPSRPDSALTAPRPSPPTAVLSNVNLDGIIDAKMPYDFRIAIRELSARLGYERD